VEVVWVTGDHLGIMHVPQVEAIAVEVQRRLERAGVTTMTAPQGPLG
jgi:hypothetical protein